MGATTTRSQTAAALAAGSTNDPHSDDVVPCSRASGQVTVRTEQGIWGKLEGSTATPPHTTY